LGLQVSVHLHGFLRDKLPPGSKGRTTLTLQDGTTVGDLLAQLDIQRRVIVSVNERPNTGQAQMLHDGDHVVVYTPVGGG
jgi:sulfur carrier protein ThiS